MGWFNFTTGVDTTNQLAGLKVDAEDISFTLNEYASAQTLTADNFLVVIDASVSNITVALPTSASHTNRIYTIKKIDASGNKVIIDANGSETIDGELTIELKLQYSYITIVCDGDEWFIIGGEYVKMEDTLDDIKDLLESMKDQDAKGLVVSAEALKHFEDFTEAEPDQEDIQEELKEMIADTEE